MPEPKKKATTPPRDMSIEGRARRAGVKYTPPDRRRLRDRPYGRIAGYVGPPRVIGAICHVCGWEEDDPKLAEDAATEHHLDSRGCYNVEFRMIASIGSRSLDVSMTDSLGR